MQLPEAFITRMQNQLGDEADLFFNALENKPSTSIRLHHKKRKSSFIHSGKVPWCDDGYYLEERPSFYMDPLWHAGAYYVQEASSMILDHILSQLPFKEASQIWIDACAAPGGKSGILAKHLRPNDVLVANEVVGSRRSILWENLTKAGYTNTFIAGEPVTSFQEEFADLILVDAPCAGEGMMRKESEAINQWNQSLVESCSTLQKQIVQGAAKALNPDGYLIYSTCSYSVEENINNVNYFIDQYELESVAISFPSEWGISHIENGDANGYQLYPHRLQGEGLFISVLKNNSAASSTYRKAKKPFRIFESIPTWLKSHVLNPDELSVRKNSVQNELVNNLATEKANEVLMHFPKAMAVVGAGELKGRNFVPGHALATSGMSGAQYESIAVDLSTALDYLERSTSTLPRVDQNGWYLVRFEGIPLGWAKWTGQGWKNHYPMSWRLRDRHK